MVNGTTTRWPFFSVDFGADLDHLAHELVAEDVARLHRRDVAVVEVQVRAADRGRGDLDDRVARIDDLGIVDRVDADVVLAVPGERAHQAISSSSCLRVQRGGGDLAGFHQLLEAAQVAARLDRGLALEQLGDQLADRAAGRIVGDRRGDDRAARAGVAELDAAANWRRRRRPPIARRSARPRLSSVIARVPFDGLAAGRLDHPVRALVVERRRSRTTFSMKRRQVREVAAIGVQLVARAG